MGFDRYPAVDDNTEFPPEVAKANMPIVLSTSQRDALAAARKWDGRQIYNSTAKRYERWDSAAGLWRTIADQQDMSTLLTSSAPVALAAAAAVGTSNFAARSDHVHPTPPEPTFTNYTPTINGASGGAIPGYTAGGQYFEFGKFIFFTVAITITNIGSVPTTDGLTFSLPKTAISGATCIISGRGNAIGGWMLQGVINGGTNYAVCFRYDNAGIVQNGQAYLFTGGYRAL